MDNQAIKGFIVEAQSPEQLLEILKSKFVVQGNLNASIFTQEWAIRYTDAISKVVVTRPTESYETADAHVVVAKKFGGLNVEIVTRTVSEWMTYQQVKE